MSTLQSTTGLRETIRSRLGTILLAVSVLCAIGVAVLILVPGGHHARKPIPPISVAHTQAAPAVPAAQAKAAKAATPAPSGSFRDPRTHALLLVHGGGGGGAPLPAKAATPAPSGSFRDPRTHALLLVHGGGGGGAPLPANHSHGRIIR
jgi:hypothetical protein